MMNIQPSYINMPSIQKPIFLENVHSLSDKQHKLNYINISLQLNYQYSEFVCMYNIIIL